MGRPRKECGHTEGRNNSGKCITCQRNRNARWYRDNKDKAKARAKAHRKAHPVPADRRREQQRRYAGLPAPPRPAPSTCECCGGPPGKYAMNLDHCHDTGEFRGWLCGPCNSAIGRLGDKLEGLLKAVRYLERFLAKKELS